MQDFVLSSQVRMGSNLYFWRGGIKGVRVGIFA
jgi:hypothetical protein